MVETTPTPTPTPTPTATPLVVRVEKKRRKKRYSRGLRDVQTTNRGFLKASRRLVRAVTRGMTTYLKESNKSARKKRDGALRDYGFNVSDAIGTSLTEVSGIPRDLVRSVSTRRWRRAMRRSLKATARLNRRLLGAR
jgi:hypothetical protein